MRNIHLTQTQVKTDLIAEEKSFSKGKNFIAKAEDPGIFVIAPTKTPLDMRTLSLTNTPVNTFVIPSRSKSMGPVLQYIYSQEKCRVRVSTIAKETGFSSRTVHTCLQKLADSSLIRYRTRRMKGTTMNSASTYYITDLGKEFVETGSSAMVGGPILAVVPLSTKVAKRKNGKRKMAQTLVAMGLIDDLPTEGSASEIKLINKNNRNTSNITKEGNQKVLVKEVRECPLGPIKTMIGTEIARNSRFVEYHPTDTKGCETLLNAFYTENHWFGATIKTIAGFKLSTSETQLLFEDFFSYKRRKYSQGIMISPYLQLKLKRNMDNIESLNFEMCNFSKHWLKIYRRKLSKNQKFIKYDEYEKKRADNLLAGMRKTVENMIRDVQNKVIMKQEQNKVNKALSEYYGFIEKHPDAQDYIEHYIEQNMDYPTFYRYLDDCYPDPDMRNELQIFVMINGQKLRKALMELASKKPVDKTPIIDLNVLAPFEFVE